LSFSSSYLLSFSNAISKFSNTSDLSCFPFSSGQHSFFQCSPASWKSVQENMQWFSFNQTSTFLLHACSTILTDLYLHKNSLWLFSITFLKHEVKFWYYRYIIFSDESSWKTINIASNKKRFWKRSVFLRLNFFVAAEFRKTAKNVHQSHDRYLDSLVCRIPKYIWVWYLFTRLTVTILWRWYFKFHLRNDYRHVHWARILALWFWCRFVEFLFCCCGSGPYPR